VKATGKSSYALSFALTLVVVGCGAAVMGEEEGERLGEVPQAIVAGPLAYRGVNLCGAEFGADAWGNGSLPGAFGTTYTYPDPAYAPGYASADYYLGKGMTTFRLPFRWERLQPQRGQALDAAELGRLKTTVNRLLGKGAAVILNPQNFARYKTSLIGSAAVPHSHFADFWSRVASEFKGSPNVLFGLVNEPHDIPTEQWLAAANAAIAAIRAAGATNLVLVPGNGWTGAHSWTSTYYGTSNATALRGVVDPNDNFAFEVHQYLDPDSSGGGDDCVSATIGSERMAAFTSWLRANGKRGFLGEFGGPATSVCLAAMNDILRHVEANADVYLGWTYWAGGPWWGAYPLSLEPKSTADSAQMQALLPHITWSPPATSCAPTTYEAETMTHGTGGPTSGGWNIWSNGSISAQRTFAPGQTNITVIAAGQAAGGIWPHMVVSVGGVTIGATNVTSTSFAPYTFTFAASAGTYDVRVAFDNDGFSGSADRNLLVDKVVVGCPVPVCTTKTYEAESMTRTVGGATSGGWNLWSNGSVSTNATFGVGNGTSVVVTAAGTYAGGAWPHFVVTVGGVTIGSGYATSSSWREYPFPFTGGTGTKEVRVTFDNDYAAGGQDRNLLLDKVVVRCP
jgi:endoglucanase